MSETQTPINSELTEKQIKQRLTQQMFHQATPNHGNKLRGVGITRKSHAKSPAKRHNAKLQRAKNRAIANKKHHKTGSNKRK